MPVVSITTAQLAPAMRLLLRRRVNQVVQVARITARRGAARGRKFAIDEDVFAEGNYANSFEARDEPGGALIVNTAPHAGVIELGRRPGAAPPPIDRIARWMVFRGIATPGDRGIFARAANIAKSIGRRGIKPRRVMLRVARWSAKAFRQAILTKLRGT